MGLSLPVIVAMSIFGYQADFELGCFLKLVLMGYLIPFFNSIDRYLGSLCSLHSKAIEDRCHSRIFQLMVLQRAFFQETITYIGRC